MGRLYLNKAVIFSLKKKADEDENMSGFRAEETVC